MPTVSQLLARKGKRATHARYLCIDCKRNRASGGMARCNDCARERHLKFCREAQAIVATGKCPSCGRKLRRNWSIPGWHQCSQYGAVGFRADASAPECNFQCFTE